MFNLNRHPTSSATATVEQRRGTPQCKTLAVADEASNPPLHHHQVGAGDLHPRLPRRHAGGRGLSTIAAAGGHLALWPTQFLDACDSASMAICTGGVSAELAGAHRPLSDLPAELRQGTARSVHEAGRRSATKRGEPAASRCRFQENQNSLPMYVTAILQHGPVGYPILRYLYIPLPF
ncbi:unnamed protein product [Urochloa humidicola]